MAKAISLAPDYNDAHWNEALTRLLLGDFERGFEKYEHRWRTDAQKHLQRHFQVPLWLGSEPLAGKRFSFTPSKAVGDTIQFARYVPLLAAQGAKVILEVQPALHSLMSGIESATGVMARGDALPPFDLHCPIMSLPLALKTSLDDHSGPRSPISVRHLIGYSDGANVYRRRKRDASRFPGRAARRTSTIACGPFR